MRSRITELERHEHPPDGSQIDIAGGTQQIGRKRKLDFAVDEGASNRRPAKLLTKANTSTPVNRNVTKATLPLTNAETDTNAYGEYNIPQAAFVISY